MYAYDTMTPYVYTARLDVHEHEGGHGVLVELERGIEGASRGARVDEELAFYSQMGAREAACVGTARVDAREGAGPLAPRGRRRLHGALAPDS